MTTPKQITLRLPCEVYEALEVEANPTREDLEALLSLVSEEDVRALYFTIIGVLVGRGYEFFN